MRSLFVLLLLAAPFLAKEVAINNERCKQCAFLVETFEAGLEKTKNKHFAGGDTAWEEKNLGRYATSETRLVEVMEGVCKKSSVSDTNKYNSVKELEFKCSALFEDAEERVEEWYKEGASGSLFDWLCVNELKYCCPEGKWGVSCSACPGLVESSLACTGRGECHGSGSRQGTGKCKCEKGYVGHACNHCDGHYFESIKNVSFIECKACHESCAGGCTAEGPKGCKACLTGWLWDAEEGCKDVDECADGTKCTAAYEKCNNSPGSFSCDCVDGYRRNSESNVCELDVQVTTPAPEASEDEEEDDDEDEEDEKEKETTFPPPPLPDFPRTEL